MHKEQLHREQRFLRRKLEQLSTQTGLNLNGFHGLHGLSSSAPTGSSCGSAAAAAAAAATLLSKRRSVSECSVGTASSTSSTASSRNSDRSAGSPSVSESGEFLSFFSTHPHTHSHKSLLKIFQAQELLIHRARFSYQKPPHIWRIATLFPKTCSHDPDLSKGSIHAPVVFPLFREARNYRRSLAIRKDLIAKFFTS